MTLKAVFFDLDGTLLDTAKDLARALNKLLIANGRPALDQNSIRKVVSDGAYAMLKLAFDKQPGDPSFEPLRASLLNYYLEDIAAETTPFVGIETLIEQLAANNITWGIATNKPWAYTEPLMQAFSFAAQPIATICPEHVTHKKPSAESLLLACEYAKCSPNEAIYIGDHQRDIECGQNANMATIAVGYGYINDNDNHEDWGATHSVQNANDIWPILKSYI